MKKTLLWTLFFLNLGVIVLFWWLGSGSYLTGSVPLFSGVLIAFGRLAGLLAEYFILLQLVLVGRIRPVERLYGFDKLNYLHRIVGFVILGLLLFHPIALSYGYAALNGGVVSIGAAFTQFLVFLSTWSDVFAAFLALVLLIAIISITIGTIRKKLRYETWYFIHFLMYLVIGLAFTHQINTADVSKGIALYYWFILNFTVFGLVLMYRFIRPLWLFNRHQFQVEKIVQETPTVYSIYIMGHTLEQFHFDAGQFANLMFLAKDRWYAHPFSFSAAYNGRSLRFSIKAVGDFTSTIATLVPGTKVIIDGPYGTFTEAHAKTADAATNMPAKFLFIAGGIGITPIRAMAEDAHESGNDSVILYGARTADEVAFKEEFARLSVPLVSFLSDEQAAGAEHGFIDEPAIRRLVPDVAERDVYVCGPLPMMKSVIAVLKALGVPKRHIHYEIFAY